MKIVRICHRQGGMVVDTSEKFDPGDFLDSIPVPGDKIVSPWARDGGSRTDVGSRTVYEVVERYFLPNAYGRDPDKAEDSATNRIVHAVMLIVSERPAEGAERLLLWA